MTESMTSRERVRRALTFQRPDRAPRDLWMLGTIPIKHRRRAGCAGREISHGLHACALRWHDKLADEWSAEAGANYATSPGGPRQPSPDYVGRYVDEWGCEWEVLEPGVVGEVIHPRLADWSDLASFSPPYELLENLDTSADTARSTSRPTSLCSVRPWWSRSSA